jgi:hypothetical protein
MGKGIFILFYLIAIPCSILLLIAWPITYWKYKKHTAGIILISFWGLFIGGALFLSLLDPYLKPMIVLNEDIYGTYIIDKDKFSGKQADWQYENIRLKLTDNDEIILETRTYEDHWKSEKVKISFTSGYYNLDLSEYCNRRVIIHSDSTNHHIISDNPTLYRKSFNRFYYMFESKKYGNVFFKKGNWK